MCPLTRKSAGALAPVVPRSMLAIIRLHYSHHSTPGAVNTNDHDTFRRPIRRPVMQRNYSNHIDAPHLLSLFECRADGRLSPQLHYFDVRVVSLLHSCCIAHNKSTTNRSKWSMGISPPTSHRAAIWIAEENCSIWRATIIACQILVSLYAALA